MRRTLAVVFACFLFTVACSDRDSDTAAELDRELTALDRVIASRIRICIDNGATRPNCECRANTSARYLSFKDFAEETRLLQYGDPRALDEFQRRMFAEQKETMFKLGQALASCPIMRIETE